MSRDGGGWTRVTLVDIASGDACPAGWADAEGDAFGPACRRAPTNTAQAPATFPVVVPFTEVLGTVQAVARGNLDAFDAGGSTLDANYVDGVSITTGAPRQHIFTLAASHNDTNNDCPADG
jgi:hypothetical protein